MSQPVPETPTNVQRTNPYSAMDRGLFIIQYPEGPKFARVNAARYLTQGPNAAVGVLEYQVMQYASMPKSAAEYGAGTLLKAPDGTEWFDRLVRGPVLDSIVVEYWAINSFINWYHGQGGDKLTDGEKENIQLQAMAFVKATGSWCGLTGVELVAVFAASSGVPIERISATLGFDYTKDGSNVHVDETNLPAGEFDPVRVALNIIQQRGIAA